ncbi:hypothetical protein Tco_1543170 [Tanacetum coccineum]
MKFLTPKGIDIPVTRLVIILECRRLEKKQATEEKPVNNGDKKEEGAREVSMTKEVLVNPVFPDKLVIIEGGLLKECKLQLKMLLKNNMEFFAWEPSDLTGVPRRIIEHTLNANASVELMCQKRRLLSLEKNQAVNREVVEWIKAGIVRPFCLRGRNLEEYIDDMVIKSNDEKMLLADIVETFDNLKRIYMKLNPKKRSFGMEEGKFLGYMVTLEGIQANPKKTKALADMHSPRMLKEMQSLSRKLAALNHFLARLADVRGLHTKVLQSPRQCT